MAIILLFLVGFAVFGFFARPSGLSNYLLGAMVVALTSMIWFTGV